MSATIDPHRNLVHMSAFMVQGIREQEMHLVVLFLFSIVLVYNYLFKLFFYCFCAYWMTRTITFVYLNPVHAKQVSMEKAKEKMKNALKAVGRCLSVVCA